jgi:hypothetical protein
MRRRVGFLVLLIVVWLMLFVQHVRIQHQDHGWLLNVYESTLDVKGFAADQWVRAQRLSDDCQGLQRASAQAPPSLVQAIHGFSPPDSTSARILWLGTAPGWGVAELEFDMLSPAVIVLRQDSNGWHIPLTGIWSGHTHPWRPSPLIRNFLSARNPEVPAPLLRCWQAQHPIWNQQN